jgi:hypothetical protein
MRSDPVPATRNKRKKRTRRKETNCRWPRSLSHTTVKGRSKPKHGEPKNKRRNGLYLLTVNQLHRHLRLQFHVHPRLQGMMSWTGKKL